jgi:hypothetical protein
MGQLVKIEFSYHTLTIRQGSGLYVHRVMTGRTSDTIPYVHYVGFQGEPHFLSTVRLFSSS